MLAHVLCIGFAGFVAYTARPGAPDSCKLIRRLLLALLICYNNGLVRVQQKLFHCYNNNKCAKSNLGTGPRRGSCARRWVAYLSLIHI